MKLKNFLKLFSMVAFLAIGCGFSAFAAKETFTVDGTKVAVYEFVEGKDRGIADLNTILAVHQHVVDPKQNDDLMEKFASFIRKKCYDKGIKLDTVMTMDLIYHVTKGKDLIIEARPRCTDFVVKKWALIAMNCVNGMTSVCYDKSDPVTVLVPIEHGCYEVKKRVTYHCAGITWGIQLNNVIINDPKIKPRTYYDFRGTGMGGVEISSEAAGWYALFGANASCRCRNFTLCGQTTKSIFMPCK